MHDSSHLNSYHLNQAWYNMGTGLAIEPICRLIWGGRIDIVFKEAFTLTFHQESFPTDLKLKTLKKV